jgi:ABC-type multidrug transport system ATPase subunit
MSLIGNPSVIFLDEAEQLANRIAILRQGRIIVNGTFAELKQLFPPATVEYAEKQPALEESFLAISVATTRATPSAEQLGGKDDRVLLRRHRCSHGADPVPCHTQHGHHHHDRTGCSPT